MSDVVTAGAFWDREIVEHLHTSWMDDPRVLNAIRERIGRDAPMSQGDWFVQYLHGRTFERGLSIGCGVGNLEREAIRRGVCKRMDALDVSVHSLRRARVAAQREGYADRIHYFAADFNAPVLPTSTYDIVFLNQCVHHVGKLEKLFRTINASMTADGILYLDEYIGPSRTDWNDALIAPHRAVFATLPAEIRKSEFLPLPIQPDDPSEAIRSSEIVAQLAIGFRIEEFRGYGGNLLAVLYPLIDWHKAPDGLIQTLLEKDGAMAAADGPYYALIVGRPAGNLRKLWASCRWYLEPKMKRISEITKWPGRRSFVRAMRSARGTSTTA